MVPLFRGELTLILTHLIGIPAMPLCGKVVRPRQALQVFGQLDGLPICKKIQYITIKRPDNGRRLMSLRRDTLLGNIKSII